MITNNARPGKPYLTSALTVNALIAWYPSVLPVLNGFGIDTCCGGAKSLELAAQAANVPLDALMAGISAAVERTELQSSHGARLSPTGGAGR